MGLAHQQAWDKVKSQIFGSVCEVARRTPWGFKRDDDNIDNKTVKEYLGSKDFFDTVILHILSGEGEGQSQIIDVLNHAYANSVKILVLEHNPYHEDWNDLSREMISSKPRDIDFIRKWISAKKEKFDEHTIGNGRNLLISFTTMQPLHLPQLSNDYLKENIDKKYVSSFDCGIDKKFKVYTHTSEYKIDFNLPEGKIYWTIGGGLSYESMSSNNENILFDSVLLQVLRCGFLYKVDKNKLKRIFKDIDKIGKGSPDTLPHWYNRPNLWRKVKSNEVIPNSIIHKNIEDLNCENHTVYVSSINRRFWRHLESRNNIIDSWTKRDFPVFYPRGTHEKIPILFEDFELCWKNNLSKFISLTKDINYFQYGIFYTEAYLFCCVCDLLGVDLILESGTANGQSTEVFGTYLNKDIISIDFDKFYHQHQNTSQRLNEYENIKLVKGDSHKELPKLAEQNKDKKIAVFIDGPKWQEARDLGQSLTKKYKNILCVGYYDLENARVIRMLSNNPNKIFDSQDIEFINKDYWYLNDKIPNNYLEKYPKGPRLTIEVV